MNKDMSLFEFDDHVIVLSEVALVVKGNSSDVYKALYPNLSEYNVYFKNSSEVMGIGEKDIERFKAALREYYKRFKPKYNPRIVSKFWKQDGEIGGK